MICGGGEQGSASSTCTAEDEKRGHRLDAWLVELTPVRRLHECLLVPVRRMVLQLGEVKGCGSFLLDPADL
jgi:hypothetical protein